MKDVLLRLSKDPRLGDALALDSEAPCSFTLWLWEPDGHAGGPRLLYGWVIPNSHQAPGQWRVATQSVKGGNGRYIKLVLNDACRAVFSFLSAMLEGRSLQEACAALNVEVPRRGGSFRLAGPGESPGARYAVSPVTLLETRDATLNRASFDVPMRSPNTAAPAWSFSLFLVDKQHLRRSLADGNVLDDVDERLKGVLEYLTSETGLDFKGTDAARVGDIDFMAFPSADALEQPRAHVEVLSSGKGREKRAERIQVSLAQGALSPEAEIIVRCQQQAGREVACDVSRVVRASALPLEFDVVEPLGNTTVGIWLRSGESSEWHLWFTQRYHWVRQINLQLGLMGVRSRIGSGLLTSFNSPKWQSRVSRLMERTQVHYRQTTSGVPEHPWEESTRQGRKMASQLFPKASGARFFRKGWAQEDRLAFLEWLLGVVKRTHAGRLVLIDPYFDTIGVELLARMEATQVAYTVVTCSQIASEDDPKGGDLPRAERLKAACDVFAPILGSLKLEILDLRSSPDRGAQEAALPDKATPGKSKRLLHDRYLLLFDDQNVLDCGYHLSNSIQAATRNHPLLVTPIPEDVLNDVGEYFHDILSRDKHVVGEAEIVQLFSSQDSQRTDMPAIEPISEVDRFSLERAPEICALLWADDSLLAVPAHALKEVMDGSDFPAGAAQRLARQLVECNSDTFHRLWSTWASFCAHDHNLEDMKWAVVTAGGERLAQALARELEAGADYPPPLGVKDLSASRDALLLAHHFQASFEEALEQAGHFIERPMRSYGLRAWGLRYAAEILTRLAPNVVVALAGALMAQITPTPDGVSSRSLLNMLTILLEPICNGLAVAPREELVRALLGGRSGFLRALGARAITDSQRVTAERGIELLHALNDNVEAIHALAEWVGDLRVEANRQGYQESEELLGRRLRVMRELSLRWSAEKDPSAYLKNIFDRVSGPGSGSWARSTVSELLLPLVNQGVLPEKDILSLLASTLFERLESHFTGDLNGEGGGGRRYQYYSATDGELTDVVAALLAQTEPDTRREYLARISRAMKPGWLVLHGAFARSANYGRWAAARDGLVWAAAFWDLLWLHGSDAALEKAELDDIHNEVQENWSLLDKYINIDRYGDPTGLLALAEDVRATVRGRVGTDAPATPVVP